MNSQIAITGIGVISSIGDTVEEFWERICLGETKVRPCWKNGNTFYAALLENYEPQKYLGRRGFKYYSTCTRYLLSGILQAIADASLETAGEDLGIVTGTALSSAEDWVRLAKKIRIGGYEEISPMESYNFSMNMPSSISSIKTKAQALNITLCSGMGAGVDAVMYAADALLLDRAKAVVAAGVEEMEAFAFDCFKNSGYLSSYKEKAAQPAAPFDVLRDGIALGEGSAALVFEKVQDAIDRKAKIYGLLSGYHCGFIPDAGSDSDSSDAGKMVCIIKEALRRASVKPAEVDVVISGGSGSVWADEIEALAICEVLGGESNDIPVTSIKGATGEGLAVSGILQHAVAALTTCRSQIPPTVGSDPFEPIAGLSIPKSTMNRDVKIVLVTLFCDDGYMFASIMKKYWSRQTD